MKTVRILTAIILLAIFVIQPISFAESVVSNHSLIEVGNKTCPVSGGAIDSMGKPAQIEYNGKLYNLCCKMCAKDFEKNPQKYS